MNNLIKRACHLVRGVLRRRRMVGLVRLLRLLGVLWYRKTGMVAFWSLMPCPYTINLNYDSILDRVSESIQFQTKTRTCTNPPPSVGGAPCRGRPRSTRPCSGGGPGSGLVQCPVDGGWTEWSGFTQCSASCGFGTRSRHEMLPELPISCISAYNPDAPFGSNLTTFQGKELHQPGP